MPELPEVEIVVLGLREFLCGHSIREIHADSPKSLRISEPQINKHLLRRKITGLRRVGKMILIDLDNNKTLVIHLKMTGQLVYRENTGAENAKSFGAGHPTDSLISKLPDKTTRVIFSLDRQAILYFNDVRKFGWIKIISSQEAKEVDFISKLGPDALDINSKEFVHRLSPRKKNIKACLLDQTIVAGCGNIYADESLWMSKIHPAMAACGLTVKQLTDLHGNLQTVLNFSISKGGSSSRNYVNASGEKGRYLDFVHVYQRKSEPCIRCQTPIERIIVAGRGTHVCPVCQKI